MITDDRVFGTPFEIICASPIVVFSQNRPRRIVLYKCKKDEYVVHEEYLESTTPKDIDSSCGFIHSSFECGSYFRFDVNTTQKEALSAALKEFNERAKVLAMKIYYKLGRSE